MSDRRDGDIERSERLIPELTHRLRRHGLGEIEVRHGALRIRVSGGGEVLRAPEPPPAKAAAPPPERSASGSDPVASPGVGYFLYGEGLGPGLEVSAGDVLGHVEVLGVRHDVRAPIDGTVRHLVAETGEAVEYGQTLIELEPAP